MALSIPVVEKGKREEGWSRHAATLQCTFGPLWFVFITGQANKPLGHLLLWQFQLIVGVSISILVFILMGDRAPVWHWLRALVGLSQSVLWIYFAATEIVDILNTLGIYYEVSEALLGILVVATANSIGDLAANFAMARNGYPQMAASACIATPVITSLLGIGFSYSFVGRSYFQFADFSWDSMMKLRLFALMLMLMAITLLLGVIYYKFEGTKGVAVMTMVFYAVACLLTTKQWQQ